MVSFDPNYICYNHEPPRLDFALLIYLAWRGVSWLGLVDEASLWTSVAMVWVLSFGIMKAMEALAARARLVELRLSSTYAE